MIVLTIVVFFTSFNTYCQVTSKTENVRYEIDIEEFMGYFDNILTDDLIDEMTYNLPEYLTIINFGIGDFSGDGLLDLAISYKDNTCSSKSYKVVLLLNVRNETFEKIFETELKWRDTPFDIGFSFKGNVVSITSRKNKNWILSAYTYVNNELKLVRNELF